MKDSGYGHGMGWFLFGLEGASLLHLLHPADEGEGGSGIVERHCHSSRSLWSHVRSPGLVGTLSHVLHREGQLGEATQDNTHLLNP